MKIKNQVLSIISKHYLNSSDFNGILLKKVKTQIDLENNEFLNIVIDLIKQNKIDLIFNDSINPYIKHFDVGDVESQLKKIETLNYLDSCAYPSKEHLKSIVNPEDYRNKPFSLKLALGEPQLSFYPFDLAVLEIYRNDPRYWYSTDDISGYISIVNEHYQREDMKESDKILLEKFGFCYDNDLNRGVAVFLGYLNRLSPEHQQIWNAKMLNGDYKLHPEYYNITIGVWPQNSSIFKAFIKELELINIICKTMEYPPLFRESYSEKKPVKFSLLIRPTEEEYQNFIHLLDKMLSDNINKDFFKKSEKIELSEERPRKDGKIEIIQKGTLTLLKEWLNQEYTFPDPKPFEEMMTCFKKVRKERQKPAHDLDDNRFDQEYFKKQRELIFHVYNNLRLLRIILAQHPLAKKVDIPNWIEEGKIINY